MEQLDKETSELVTMGMAQLSLSRSPDDIIKEAKRAADALKRILDGKDKKLFLNKSKPKEQYLEFGDWQLLGKFYGLSASVIPGSTKPIQVGSAVGFESAAEAIQVATGNRVSAADAMCLNDEENWKDRPQYETKKVDGADVKEQVGSKSVPMFQLRSMAQTRACSKALSNALRWVIVLSGKKDISGTPAEEMVSTDASELSPHNSDCRIIAAKWEKECPVCKKKIAVGDKILYNGKTKVACHEACATKEDAAKAAAG